MIDPFWPPYPCELAVISWRFRGDLSPQNHRDSEHARILMRFTGVFFQFESNKLKRSDFLKHLAIKNCEKTILKNI